MKKIIFSIALLPAILVQAQDIHFSQLNQTPLLLNPANAALGHTALAIINYKDQWKSVGSPYKTFNVSADFAIVQKPKGNHLGIGLDVFADKAGDAGMGTTTGQLHFSGVVAADDNNLISGGLYAGFGQRSLQYDKLYWDNQYDGMAYNPNLASGEPTTFANHNYFDVGAGMAWFYSKGHSTLSSNDQMRVTLGFAVQHLNKPVYSFYGDNSQRLPIRYVFHGNGDIGIKNYSLVLEPQYIVMIQAGHHEITPGLMVKYIMQEASHYTGRKKPAAVALGGYFRMKDALCVCARYEFSNWSIGTSYDVNISQLKTVSNSRGGFEISIAFMTPNPFGTPKSVKMFN